MGHDPLKFAAEFGVKLAARSRHICAFFGAGTSRAAGLPDISALRDRVLARLSPEDATFTRQLLNNRNLEQVLSRLRRIAALVEGNDLVDGLTAQAATNLDVQLCKAIVQELNVAEANLHHANLFAAWVARTSYRLPIEIFTVNYDLLLETAFDQMKVPCFDGFLGTLKAAFYIDLVEHLPADEPKAIPSFFVRLWKLHGSINWAWEGKNKIVRLGQPVQDAQPAAIYPSDAKYEESRRVPFVVLQDRFRRALHTPESLTIISGYSFGDEHLNEMIFDAAIRKERSEIIAFCFDDIPGKLRETALKAPNLQAIGRTRAIISGVEDQWTAPDGDTPGIWEQGIFLLPDFSKLAAYLAKSAQIDSQVLPGHPLNEPARPDEIRQ